jgi:hypothetical protein
MHLARTATAIGLGNIREGAVAHDHGINQGDPVLTALGADRRLDVAPIAGTPVMQSRKVQRP